MKKCRTLSSCSIICLPDEIILQILNKIIDLKTLCICKLVSKRFYWIVIQVDTIVFTASPLVNPSNFDWNTCEGGYYKKLFWFLINGVVFNLLRNMIFSRNDQPIRYPPYVECRSLWSAMTSMARFRWVKCLHIELPSSCHKRFLFKWKIKFGDRVDTFLFLSPNSIFDVKGLYVNGNDHEEEEEDIPKKFVMMLDCLKEADLWLSMLLDCTIDFPLLQKVSITDSCKRGTISLNGGKISQLRRWLYSPRELVAQKLNMLYGPRRISKCHVPLLELPVSGYVMKGVTLYLLERNDLPDQADNFMNIGWNDLEDKEEVAYNEAVIEIFKTYRGWIERW